MCAVERTGGPLGELPVLWMLVVYIRVTLILVVLPSSVTTPSPSGVSKLPLGQGPLTGLIVPLALRLVIARVRSSRLVLPEASPLVGLVRYSHRTGMPK